MELEECNLTFVRALIKFKVIRVTLGYNLDPLLYLAHRNHGCPQEFFQGERIVF